MRHTKENIDIMHPPAGSSTLNTEQTVNENKTAIPVTSDSKREELGKTSTDLQADRKT